MKSVASSLPNRFIPRFAPSLSSSSSSSRLVGLQFNKNNNGGSYLPLPPSFKSSSSQLRMASTNQNASTAADANPQLNVFQPIQAPQEKAARLPPIEEIRTFLNYISLKYEGYPSGSMVDFACDAYGSPILVVSSLAVHTKVLLASPRCSLLVSKDPEDRTDLVITVHGDALPVFNNPKGLSMQVPSLLLVPQPSRLVLIFQPDI